MKYSWLALLFSILFIQGAYAATPMDTDEEDMLVRTTLVYAAPGQLGEIARLCQKNEATKRELKGIYSNYTYPEENGDLDKENFAVFAKALRVANLLGEQKAIEIANECRDFLLGLVYDELAQENQAYYSFNSANLKDLEALFVEQAF